MAKANLTIVGGPFAGRYNLVEYDERLELGPGEIRSFKIRKIRIGDGGQSVAQYRRRDDDPSILDFVKPE